MAATRLVYLIDADGTFLLDGDTAFLALWEAVPGAGGARATGWGGGMATTGLVYLIDADGAFLLDADGAFLVLWELATGTGGMARPSGG
jgi:hypothetical protein